MRWPDLVLHNNYFHFAVDESYICLLQWPCQKKVNIYFCSYGRTFIICNYSMIARFVGKNDYEISLTIIIKIKFFFIWCCLLNAMQFCEWNTFLNIEVSNQIIFIFSKEFHRNHSFLLKIFCESKFMVDTV